MDTSVVATGSNPMVTSPGSDKLSHLYRLKDRLLTLRQPWETLYKEAAQYLIPSYSDWDLSPNAEGKRLTKPVFNSRPIYYVATVCAGLQGYLTPQGGKWAVYELDDHRLMSLPGVRGWLQACGEHMDSAMADSGFYTALSEGYPQLVGLGTHHVQVAEDVVDGRLQFISMHPKHVAIHTDRYGRVHAWVIQLDMTIEQIEAEYPGMLPETERRLLATQPWAERRVSILVLPESVDSPRGKGGGSSKPWATYHLLDAPRVLLREGATRYPPIITGRWSRGSDEIYGRGWGLDVLSDVLRLNQLTKAELKAAQWAVDPAILYPSEMREEIELVPGARIPYFNPAKEVKPLFMGGNYPIGKDAKQDLEASIFEQLMVSFFLSLLQQQGSRTATEVLELQGEKAAILGTMVSRTENETVRPMVARLWDYEMESGRLPEPPRVLTRRGAKIRMRMVGPLAQIAKRFHTHQGVSQALSTFFPLVELSQGQVLDIVDWDELGRHVLDEDTAFPKTAVREKDLVVRIREQRAQAMQQQQQMEQLQAVGKAGPGIAAMKNAGVPGMPGVLGA